MRKLPRIERSEIRGTFIVLSGQNILFVEVIFSFIFQNKEGRGCVRCVLRRVLGVCGLCRGCVRGVCGACAGCVWGVYGMWGRVCWGVGAWGEGP